MKKVIKKFNLMLTETEDGNWYCSSQNDGFSATQLAYFLHDKCCDVFKQGMGLCQPKIKYRRAVTVCTRCKKLTDKTKEAKSNE